MKLSGLNPQEDRGEGAPLEIERLKRKAATVVHLGVHLGELEAEGGLARLLTCSSIGGAMGF